MAPNRSTRSGFAVALTAAAVAGLGTFGVGAAQAAPAPRQCQAADVTAATTERPSPDAQERRYELTVRADPGVTCALSGAPQELTFYGPSGALPITVDTPPPGTGQQVLVTANRPVAALLTGPATEGPARATSVSVTLPGDDTPIRTGWVRGGVDGPLQADAFVGTPA